MKKNRIAIIGAGSVGVNLAIFLAKYNLEVHLLESKSDILYGAPMVSFINHGDGFEYYKAGHQTTGIHCIDGSITKGLIYPMKFFKTDVISENNPIRFLVSKESVNYGSTRMNNFYQNADTMYLHFKKQFKNLMEVRSCKEVELEKMLLRRPDNFYQKLEPDDYSDLMNIEGGCFGSSFGINMSQYYSYMKNSLKKFEVVSYFNTSIEKIEKSVNKITIHADRISLEVDFVFIAASHEIPRLESILQGTSIKFRSSGTYYLNCMTFLSLPPTNDPELIRKLKKINFTLQGEFGGMYACITPPTNIDFGMAAIYNPSTNGSQFDNSLYNKNYPKINPKHWNNLIESGLSNDTDSVQYTFSRACHYYPFLKDYAIISRTDVRPVFNLGVPDSFKGWDRRVRELPNRPIMFTEDGTISMWTAPKWTNSELVALIATDALLKKIGKGELPKDPIYGVGPTKIDIAKLTLDFNIYDTKMKIEDALYYAKLQGIPSSIVNADHYKIK